MFKNLLNIFKKKKNQTTDINTSSDDSKEESRRPKVLIEIIDISPNVYLTHTGARICVGKGPVNGFNNQLNHVGKVIGMNHESVMEHTNVVILLTFEDKELSFDILEFIGNCKFMNVRRVGNTLLIGASARAIIHFLRECPTTNKYYYVFQYVAYHSLEKEFLSSVMDFLDKEKCIFTPNMKIELKNDEADVKESSYYPPIIKGDRVDIVYHQDPIYIYNKIKDRGYLLRDAYAVSIVSIIFHDISRSCGNQLTRHRDAISQESQRYVLGEYTIKDSFVNPISMNDNNRYDNLPQKVIDKLNSDVFYMYRYAISATVFKEDARAWLPMNVKTKIMMTFTYTNLGYFLKLRTSRSAQKEIRLVAEEIAKHIPEFTGNTLESLYINTTIPYNTIYNHMDDYKELITIDEDLGTVLEEVDPDKEPTPDQVQDQDPKPLNINSIDDAKRYMEEAKKLKDLEK